MSEWVIRPARPLEAELLTQIAWESKRHWGYPDAWMARWRAALEISPSSVEAQPFFVSAQNERVMAFCALLEERPHWDLDHLWVGPEFIGRGVGRELFRHATTYLAHRTGGTTLRVESEPKAEGFYVRMGARRVRTVIRDWEGLRRELPCLELPIAELPEA